MKLRHLFFVLLAVSCSLSKEKPEPEQWIQLFNGKDLTGWDIKISGYPLNENYNNTFRVEDSILKVVYDEYETFDNQFGHLFYNQKFSQYKLRFQYRFVGEQSPNGPEWAYKNSGAMLHSQSAASMELAQSFPVSIEAQLLGGHAEGDRPTGNLCTPGTNVVIGDSLWTEHCLNSKSKTYRGEEWVTAEFVVYGDSLIHHIINGDTVLTYTKPQIGGGNGPENYPVPVGTLIKEGYIALQAESHPVHFRKIELLDLSVKPKTK